MPEKQPPKEKPSKKPTVYLMSLFNPVRIIRAMQFHRKQKKYSKASHDLELGLYSEMLLNDMLHYGYFDDIHIEPDRLSFHDVESAQIRYAEKLISLILDKSRPVLDIGCGIGGIANLIQQHGFQVEVLSPNTGQINYVRKTYPALPSHHLRFEEFKSEKKFGTLLNAESFQYIDMQKAFEKADEIIAPEGRWVICDYFSIQPRTDKKPQKRLEDFEEIANEHGWNIIYREDITMNVLPTLKFANMYVTRIVNPILYYLESKLLVKLAWLHHLTHEIRDKLSKKLTREFSKLDTRIFLSEKKYLILVLTKK